MADYHTSKITREYTTSYSGTAPTQKFLSGTLRYSCPPKRSNIMPRFVNTELKAAGRGSPQRSTIHGKVRYKDRISDNRKSQFWKKQSCTFQSRESIITC